MRADIFQLFCQIFQIGSFLKHNIDTSSVSGFPNKNSFSGFIIWILSEIELKPRSNQGFSMTKLYLEGQGRRVLGPRGSPC